MKSASILCDLNSRHKFVLVAFLHDITKTNNQQQVPVQDAGVHLLVLFLVYFYAVCPKSVKWPVDAVFISSSCVHSECVSATWRHAFLELRLYLGNSQSSLSDWSYACSHLSSVIDETLQYPSVTHTALLSKPFWCSFSTLLCSKCSCL